MRTARLHYPDHQKQTSNVKKSVYYQHLKSIGFNTHRELTGTDIRLLSDNTVAPESIIEAEERFVIVKDQEHFKMYHLKSEAVEKNAKKFFEFLRRHGKRCRLMLSQSNK